MAESLWARLEFFRKQGETEAAELRSLQADYIDSLEHGDPAPAGALRRLRPLALRLVGGLTQGEEMFKLIDGYEHRVKAAIYALLVKRYGDQPEIRELKPSLIGLEVSNLLVRSLLLNAIGFKTEAEKLFNLSNEIDAAARGQPPPPPSEDYGVWRPGAWN